MDFNAIEKLITVVSGSKLTFLELESEGTRITMKKEATIVTTKAMETVIERESEKAEDSIDDVDCKIVKSPIVGTFYSSSGPDKDDFVKVGSKVKKGDTLCILEAMKLMNEIQSEYEGEIIEILVSDEDMVEYGQSLFKIK